ncbi:unnamed protein product [Phaedon cochleariae]|uniref:Uncharacterized protein n=1 Tax=Phaedon cochleariae TaxID=80249 RepID=A0A9N9SE35_PHACE|nr:unnamed protein product [Phaedon cochleariae]
MRRFTYSARDQEKLYTNGLCVNGARLRLLKNLKKCRANKNIQINDVDIDDQADITTTVKTHQNHLRKEEDNQRKTLKLNVTDCKNSQVFNKQLRQIYETIEVHDFERILSDIYQSESFKKQAKNKADDILTKINAEEIYQEHFGQYVDYLKNVTNNITTS